MLAGGAFPHLAEVARTSWNSPDDERFELGLAWILDGIAADLGAGR